MICDPKHWENAYPQTTSHSLIVKRLAALHAFPKPVEQDKILRDLERTQHELKLRLTNLHINSNKTRTALETELHKIESQQTERMIDLARQHLSSSVITSWQAGGSVLKQLSKTNPIADSPLATRNLKHRDREPTFD